MTQKTKRPTKPTIDDAGYKLLTSTACAKLLGITAQTVRAWCDDGRLEYFRGKGNVRYISMSEVERIRKQNAFTTVESAIERIEALNAQRDNEVRDLIIEKNSIQYHNFVALDKKIMFILKKIEKLEQAAAVKPSIGLSEKALRRIVRTALDEAARSPASQADARDGEPAPAPAARPDKAELNHTRSVSEAERNRMIGELN
jgi:DNA-binding transcriptional MerR regulator